MPRLVAEGLADPAAFRMRRQRELRDHLVG
jgi:hypothetical protein